MYIETHAHLNFTNYANDRAEVIQRAQNADVSHIINIGIDLKTSRESVQLAEKYAMIYATAGIHPHDSDKVRPEQWQQLEQLLDHPKVVAMGEIGLDYYRDYAPHDIQRQVFLRQLALAVTKKIPIVVHTRNSWHDIIDIFEREIKGKLSGVFHCFSGNKEMAKRALDWNFYISFTGVVTFKNSSALAVAKYVPEDRLLLETDCPFMAPEPFRGKRSEPAHIPLIAQKIAEAKGMNEKKIAQQTADNARRLFSIE